MRFRVIESKPGWYAVQRETRVLWLFRTWEDIGGSRLQDRAIAEMQELASYERAMQRQRCLERLHKQVVVAEDGTD